MTIRMVKSGQFGKIAEQGRKYFSGSLNEQDENLRAGWQKNLKNLSEHALLLGTSEYIDLLLTTFFWPKAKKGVLFHFKSELVF